MSAVLCSEYLQERLVKEGVADFHRLETEYLFDLVVVNTSPLHVGSGRGGEALGSAVDLSVVIGSAVVETDGGSVVYRGPVIPGSSLKGVLRSLAESIAIGLEKAVFDVELPGAGKPLRCTGESLSELESWLSKTRCSGEALKAVDNYFEKCFASPVVRLFGAPWLGSHLTVYDAHPVDGRRPPTRVVTRVAIDRLTGSQSPRKLYTMEIVDAGVEWRMRMKLVNIDPFGDTDEARLLRTLLSMLAEGVSIGRRTSAGHGLLRLLVDRSRVYVYRVDPEEGLTREEKPLEKLLKG